ncbi:hemin-degrading factor [Rhodohalobacter sp. 614A]|uniref:hemin-degrading factor n=1 Tax=Rhodohalobacter sp. 614A TaxID=2908649 RepID=UPI001F2ACBF9|nr:ChuX/HutX family heme-like substrate-binding protein [Rhodohalobacter sp. 614A]
MNTTVEERSTSNNLKERWDQLKADNPRLRTKNAADELGVSEAELVASICDGKTVIRLKPDWEEILKAVESLGEVMALTRNESAVHEKTGTYQNISFSGHVGLVLDEQIDLRVFHKRWGFGFAVPVENPRGTLYSLQFFDKAGTAVHKIYLKEPERQHLYQAIVEEFRSEDQSSAIEISETIKKDKTISAEDVNKEEFLGKWSELKDTHDFYPLLRKYKVDRTDALKLADQKFTWKLSNDATQKMLNLASQNEVPIMVFVSSPGMIQIHSGPVNRIKVMDNWLNVLDPGFNLHLREDHIAESFIVEKPTEDGIVTSLEIFDEEGNAITTFFGARKPGKPELDSWRAITNQLKQMEVGV